jgi:GMP synthase (glutamine-hydrolysing)
MVALNTRAFARLLVVENEPDAGPAMLQTWLASSAVGVDICRPYVGDEIPEQVGHAGLLVLGGEMGAQDDHKAPWLATLRTLLEVTTARGLPVLGVCLGAQLLAAACGGSVEQSASGGELGLGRVDINDEGRRDRLLVGIASPAQAVQWHEDEIIRLPDRAVLLASSPRCKVQAYRIGPCAWGVQFHPEASGATVRGWADAENDAPPERRRQLELAVAEVRSGESRVFAAWQRFAEHFAEVVKKASG